MSSNLSLPKVCNKSTIRVSLRDGRKHREAAMADMHHLLDHYRIYLNVKTIFYSQDLLVMNISG